MSKDFWQQSFPRIGAIFLAFGFLFFTLFDLFVRDKEISSFHFWILIAACSLILATIASRLKILNFVDFDSKFKKLEKVTEKEFANIRQQLSASIKQQITPSQNVSTIVNLDLQSLMKTMGKTDVLHYERESDYNHDSFLRRADAYRLYAGSLLQIARMYQIVLTKHDFPHINSSNLFFTGDKSNQTTFEGSINRRILSWSESLLNEGIDSLFPFKIEDSDNDNRVMLLKRNTENCLRLLPSFIETYTKVSANEVEVPPFKDAKELFQKLADGLGNLRVAIILLGSQSILSLYQLQAGLNEFMEKLKSEIDSSEQRPQ